jgi:hypothetical protein
MLQPDRNRNAAERIGATSAPTWSLVRRSLALAAAVVAVTSSSPEQAAALRINSAADPALSGALIQTFDTIPVGYFTSQSFLIGSNGFTISAVANDVHIDDVFCGNFGTSGRCFDTVRSNGTANDDINVTFTGSGVSAFGFAINALDIDWTVQTFAAGDVLLNTYTITSQSGQQPPRLLRCDGDRCDPVDPDPIVRIGSCPDRRLLVRPDPRARSGAHARPRPRRSRRRRRAPPHGPARLGAAARRDPPSASAFRRAEPRARGSIASACRRRGRRDGRWRRGSPSRRATCSSSSVAAARRA